jgi:secreted trypsin-like serine protease
MASALRLRVSILTAHGALAAAGLLSLAMLTPALASAARASPRIVGGAKVEIEEFPFQVALYDPREGPPVNSRFCGGVILDATHVITAAHCLANAGGLVPPEDIEVLAGTENLEDLGEAVEDPVFATSANPEWEPQSGEHDDGVLTLQQPLWIGPTPRLNGTNRIAPIRLANKLPEAGTLVSVSGWGFTKELRGEQLPTAKEEEEGFLPFLQSVEVPIVSQQQCSEDWELEELLGPGFVCAGGHAGEDSCYGDSGGPLIEGTPGREEDRLIATVDRGYGCGDKGFPGLYQSVVEPLNKSFLESEPPQGPFEQNGSAPKVSGVAQPGQMLTCQPGSWAGEPRLSYAFFEDKSEFSNAADVSRLTSRSSNPIYAVPANAAIGTRVFCEAVAVNAGGRGEATSRDVTLSAIPQPAAISAQTPAQALATAPTIPSAVGPPTPPSLHLQSKSCKHTSCTVRVLASEGAGATLVGTVEVKLSYRQRFSCHRRGQEASCTRSITRKLAARSAPGNHFVIVASGLKPGSYMLSLIAIDKAGQRQAAPMRVTLVLTPTTNRKKK